MIFAIMCLVSSVCIENVIKTGPLLKIYTSCIWWSWMWSIYQTVQYFIWSKNFVLNFLLQLNIFCTRLLKQYGTKITIHRYALFTCYGYFVLFSPTYWISSKRSVPYIRTFITLSGVRDVFWISMQLDILCTSAVKRYYAKIWCGFFWPTLYIINWARVCLAGVGAVSSRTLCWYSRGESTSTTSRWSTQKAKAKTPVSVHSEYNLSVELAVIS